MIHIADKEIVVTLMYSQSSHRILFVEAEKDFVDVLIGFLTLPIGCAIKLLFESESRNLGHCCIHSNGTACLLQRMYPDMYPEMKDLVRASARSNF